MESVQRNIGKTIEIIGENEQLDSEMMHLSSGECSPCEDVEENDTFDQNENENISWETNPLENVSNSKRILEIPGIKENPDAEDVHQTVSARNGDQINFSPFESWKSYLEENR